MYSFYTYHVASVYYNYTYVLYINRLSNLRTA